MAIHTKLSIHVAAQGLFDAAIKAVLHMRRDAKPTIGKLLLGQCLDITTLIQRANMAEDKGPHIGEVLEKKCRVESILDSALNNKLISTGLYGDATKFATSIGKQANGWKKNPNGRQLHHRQGGDARA